MKNIIMSAVPLVLSSVALFVALYSARGPSPAEKAATPAPSIEGAQIAQSIPESPWAREIVVRVNELEQQNTVLIEKIETAQAVIISMETIVRTNDTQIATTEETIDKIELSITETGAMVYSLGTRLASTQSRIDKIEIETNTNTDDEPKLEDYITIVTDSINGLAGPHILIEGANLHIRSGGGSTDDLGGLLGLGNLIVGYNENDLNQLGPRNGSHNLVIGGGHGYSSFGGLIAGYANNLMAPNASVTGGSGNEAAGLYSSITGGSSNQATGLNASVTGGNANRALGDHSSVTGGADNQTNGLYASVTGGSGNEANALYASVTGGQDNQSNGDFSNASGGKNNRSNGRHTSILGGYSWEHYEDGWSRMGTLQGGPTL